jgi:hypothetical protein
MTGECKTYKKTIDQCEHLDIGWGHNRWETMQRRQQQKEIDEKATQHHVEIHQKHVHCTEHPRNSQKNKQSGVRILKGAGMQ